MDGIIIIDKEKGWTSNDVVQKVKNTFHSKVGHTGTLDPLATGVLPLLIGKATSLSKYLINHNKSYIATLQLGYKTTTADIEGNIVEEKEVNKENLEEKNITKILNSFIGKNYQTPPIYSAIKVNGKKLYEYARNGEKVKIAPREIEIYDIKTISISKEEQEITYKVSCSKGTYIRTLCEDIADKLGTVGFMKELKRTQVGDFKLQQAIKISEIKNDKDFLEKNLITIESFFANKESVVLHDNKLKMFLNGVNINIDKKNDIYKIYDTTGKFIGTGIIKEKKLKRDICI